MKILPALILVLTTAAWAKTSPVQILESLEKSFSERLAGFPAASDKTLEGGDRVTALLNLRYLVQLETILANLNTDEPTLNKQLEINGLSSSEKKRILELRAGVIDYLAESLASSDFKEPRSNPVDKLRKAYERKARKPLMDLAKVRKTLDQEYERNPPNERKIDELDQSIDKLNEHLDALKLAFFGNASRAGFEASIDLYPKGPASDLLEKVIAARDQLLVELRIDPLAVAKNEEVKQGEISGISIQSTNLGVVLDNSASMQPHIPALRKEIDQIFPGSHFREMYGCALTWKASPTTLGKREHVLLDMEDLVIVKETDALYWFSDLRDPQTKAGINRLTELLDRSGALLYVSSVDLKPKDDLNNLITKFSKFQKK